jgi:hypothetical protein
VHGSSYQSPAPKLSFVTSHLAVRQRAFLAEPTRSHSQNGIWEPEFTVDANGTSMLMVAQHHRQRCPAATDAVRV